MWLNDRVFIPSLVFGCLLLVSGVITRVADNSQLESLNEIPQEENGKIKASPTQQYESQAQENINPDFISPTNNITSEAHEEVNVDVSLPSEKLSPGTQENINVDLSLPSEKLKPGAQENINVDLELPALSTDNEHRPVFNININLPPSLPGTTTKENINVNLTLPQANRNEGTGENNNVNVTMTSSPQVSLPSEVKQTDDIDRINEIKSDFYPKTQFKEKKKYNLSVDSSAGVGLGEKDEESSEDLEVLLLSPLLEEGSTQKARNMSTTQFGNLTSYTGYFTVEKTCGNHLFFWFIPATGTDWTQAPVFLWLNGGPGASSMFGLFKEIGPWKIVGEKVETNEFTWTKDYNVLFFDQPVGTGFSFTENGCYATDIIEVRQQMYSALFQFFEMFPELQNNRFYMSGESHAGHYVPAIAVEIHEQNINASFKINLKGILVGNPLIDIRCVHTGRFLHELGMLDSREKNRMEVSIEEFDRAIESGDDVKAFLMYIEILGSNTDVTGLPTIYNVLYDKDVSMEFADFLAKAEIRKQIHVGKTPYHMLSEKVGYYLWNDRYTSQAPDIELLLATGNYTVGFYTGQMDARIPYSALPCALRKLKWSGSQKYLNAPKTTWYVGDRLVGWVRKAGNLYEIAVRKSGHFVPIDQGEALLELLKAVVDDTPGGELLKGLKSSLSGPAVGSPPE